MQNRNRASYINISYISKLDVLSLEILFNFELCNEKELFNRHHIWIWPITLTSAHVNTLLILPVQIQRERSHMTSAAEGFRNADGCWQGGRGSKPCWRQQKYLNFGKNCFKSSVPITMRETTALIYSPKLTTTFSVSMSVLCRGASTKDVRQMGRFWNFGHFRTGGGGVVCESSDVRKFLKKSKFLNFSELFKVKTRNYNRSRFQYESNKAFTYDVCSNLGVSK